MSELSAAERWAWVGLLLMAGDSNISGKIFLRKSAEHKLIGYSEETLAELLALTVDEFKKSIARMIKFKKISVNKSGVITILNWGKYQSEYSRQKKYRESDNKNCNFECNESNALDRDKERDKDKDKEKAIFLKNFPLFWDSYGYKINKKDAEKAFMALLRKKIEIKDIANAVKGYHNFLALKRDRENFDQAQMYPATFLRENRWKQYIDIKFKSKL